MGFSRSHLRAKKQNWFHLHRLLVILSITTKFNLRRPQDDINSFNISDRPLKSISSNWKYEAITSFQYRSSNAYLKTKWCHFNTSLTLFKPLVVECKKSKWKATIAELLFKNHWFYSELKGQRYISNTQSWDPVISVKSVSCVLMRPYFFTLHEEKSFITTV